MKKSGVYIIGCSDTNEKVCAAAGRISTQSGTALEIMDKSQDSEKNAKLISKVTSSGHTSTVEHVFFNLAFENVSVVVEQFMIEFRLASFTVKSRRYVDFSGSGYYVPDFENKELQQKYTKHMDSLFELYGELCEKGIAKEDARFVLPYCFYSNFFCSLGGRELINVLRAMIYGRGRKIREIYDLGIQLLEECKAKTPGVFSGFEQQYSKYSDELDFDFIDCENHEEAKKESVEILSLTPNAADIVAKTAIISSLGITEKKAESIIENKETRQLIIDKVIASSRPRPLENVCCTIRFNNVSLATLTHFSRHRMQSLMFAPLYRCDRSKYIIPQSVAEKKDILDKYCTAFEKTQELFELLKSAGCHENETVYCLLSGNVLDIVSTMNARELLLFMTLRSCNRAQWEIRELATQLLRQLRKLSPELFCKYGPNCFVNGFCPEGRLSCGKMPEVKQKFIEL